MYGIETYLDFDATWRTFSTGEHQQGIPDLPPMWKLAADLERYEVALEISTPEVVVEVGTKWGGSACWFRRFGVEVITVDIDPWSSRKIRARRPEGIHWVTGSSTDPAVFNQVRELVAGRDCLVTLDGEHAAPHVADEIALYSHLVRPGQYLVVEDGIFDLAGPERSALGGTRIPAEGGPLRAIWWTLVHNPLWDRDVELERLSPTTHHPAGFWRRLGVRNG